jgi:hypothetical protein
MPEQCLRFGEWGIVDGAIWVNLLRDLLFLLCQDCINPAFQILKILIDRRPQRIWVSVKVSVGKDRSHTYDFSPLYLWMLIFEIWKVARNSACRFTNNLKIVGYPGLNQFIMIVSVSPFLGIPHDTFDGILDIT